MRRSIAAAALNLSLKGSCRALHKYMRINARIRRLGVLVLPFVNLSAEPAL